MDLTEAEMEVVAAAMEFLGTRWEVFVDSCGHTGYSDEELEAMTDRIAEWARE